MNETEQVRLQERGRAQLERLLEERGGTLSAREVALLGGRSVAIVHQRRKRGELLAVRRGRGYRFPAWQFEEGGTIPGLGAVLLACALPPLQQMQFLLSPHPSLAGIPPLVALLDGESETVQQLARRAGQHGAA